MTPINVNDIVERLLEMRAYSRELAARMEHEAELPDDAVPYLVERLKKTYARCERASDAERADAYDEMGRWLVESYRFYLQRLMSCSHFAPWMFRFPVAENGTFH